MSIPPITRWPTWLLWLLIANSVLGVAANLINITWWSLIIAVHAYVLWICASTLIRRRKPEPEPARIPCPCHVCGEIITLATHRIPTITVLVDRTDYEAHQLSHQGDQ